MNKNNISLKAFSTLELLIAIAILTTAIIGASAVAFGSSEGLKSTEKDLHAVHDTSFVIHTMLNAELFDRFTQRTGMRLVNNTEIAYAKTFIDDGDSVVRIHATTTLHDSPAPARTQTSERIFFNHAHNDTRSTCDPLISGNWASDLAVDTFELRGSKIFGSTIDNDSFQLSDLAVHGTSLILSLGSTGSPLSPTLLFFSLIATSTHPVFTGAFDNASSSTIGLRALSVHGSYTYAANGFGSASRSVCGTTISCDQVHIFTYAPSGIPTRLSSLLLATSSPPFAITAAGISAGARAITYDSGYIYLGLEKTASGQEFSIIDVRDPAHPTFVAGVPVGRTINDISVYRGLAYVATDDTARELLVIDVTDQFSPRILGMWNAQGATGFGFGKTLHVRESEVWLGRSYVNNAPELFALDVSAPTSIQPLASVDMGTGSQPRIIRSIVAQDFFRYILTDETLAVVTRSINGGITPVREAIPLPGGTDGIAMSCKGGTLYVGSNRVSPKSVVLQTIRAL